MNSKTTVAKPSRKARVKELFSEQGPEEAFVLGKRLKLKASHPALLARQLAA